MCIINKIRQNQPETETELGQGMEAENKAKHPRNRRTALAVTLIVLAEMVLIVAVVLGLDAKRVRFYMTAGSEITVPYGKPYEEPGVRAVSVGRVTGESDQELPVRVSGEVDTGTMGDYELRYVTRSLLRSYSTTRTVHVADRTAPELTLLHREGYAPSWLDGYVEEGYLAVDDVDGDVSARVTVEKRGDSLFYTVSDTAGNRSETVREIPYSIGEPKLRLLGGETLVIDTGFLFEDPGFTCRDARGNDLSALVSREGEVIPYQPGDYVLRYRIENALGERVEAKRTVTVKPLQNPDPIDPAGKLIYLTFDDGPGPYTDRLLDILSQYNVKATFFVTGLYPDYADCIGRAFREGHSIGVHSACHNYRRIYASEEAFFDDFSAVQDLIYTQTGQYTSLCRFPGGSSNTVSRFNRGIMSRLTKSMEELGYHYYDWNVSSGDAGETTNTERVFENIVNGCSNQRVSVVLQHDSKEFSVAAVERVIVWGLTNGYQFVPLDESSAEIHHRIAN